MGIQPQMTIRGKTYYAAWYDPATRRIERKSLRTADPQAAATRFGGFLLPNQRPAGPLTIGQALADYREEHAREKVVDLQRIDIAIAHLLRTLRPDTHVAAVAIPASRHYRDRRASEGAAAPTIRRELGVLVAACHHAAAWQRLQGFDARCIELPADSTEPKVRWLTQSELNALRGAADDRTRDFIDLAYWTASRRHAIETLTTAQVDLALWRISLAKPGERKTKKRRPVVPVDHALKGTVTRLMGVCELTGSPWLLGHPGPVYESFMAAARRAQLEEVTPHTLRHSRATHLLRAGVSIWKVAGLLGDTIATVERTYAHHCSSELEDLQSEAGVGRHAERQGIEEMGPTA